jgi:hypothetical protein
LLVLGAQRGRPGRQQARPRQEEEKGAEKLHPGKPSLSGAATDCKRGAIW